MAVNSCHLRSFIVLLAFSTVTSADDCVYTLFIRTGSTINGGTDSIISARLYDEFGDYTEITNLKAWGGIMGLEHTYFERGNLDFFTGRAACLNGPACALNLTSDGSGEHHGWFVNYVEVNTAGVHADCSQQKFKVEQWLAVDAAPYELSAIRDNCPYDFRTGRKDSAGVQIKSASI